MFLINSDRSNGLNPSLIDVKQFFLFMIYPSFYYFNKTYSISLKQVAKHMIILSLISSFAVSAGFFPPNTIIRTDATYLIASSFLILIPRSNRDLRRYLIYYLIIFYLLLAYLGRTTILALVIALLYFMIKSRKSSLISSSVKKLYLILFLLFTGLGFAIFAIRASDIFATTGTSFVNNESRLLAMYLFLFQVIPQLNFFELIFGAGFGVDYSSYMSTSNFIINIHIDNIVTGNNNMYPALGFHNEFIRIFLLTGAIGFFIFMKFLSSFYIKIDAHDSHYNLKCIGLNTFLIMVLVSMFGHGFFGSTITSAWTLFALSYLKSETKKFSRSKTII
tara:strand:+ start:471 stop:1472 length:1002 start_codon:yes stop_codon:yes gene_type:complete